MKKVVYALMFLLSVYCRCFTSLCYTADGKCILAGGRSKFVCIYHVDQQVRTLLDLRVFVGKSVNGMKTRAYCIGTYQNSASMIAIKSLIERYMYPPNGTSSKLC